MDSPAASMDHAHDVLHEVRRPLGRFFLPKSVAVIGASEKQSSVGRTILWNLVSNPFGGTVYPVNPKRANVLGIRAYPSVSDVPDNLDLVVVTTPASTVPAIIADCAAAGVKDAIIISAGFKEMGAEGAALENEILTHARRGQMRIIGPNCLGVMNPVTGMNATFARGIARPGHIAFISQSGALLSAILDWSLREQVGFSAIISVGSMLDVSWGDLIDHFGDDPNTQAILIYMESIGDARSFLSAAREVALSKPIIVIKSGRTAAAARAAVSHTGALTGTDEVLEAAFARAGVLRVRSIDELFNMAEVLAKQQRPKGPRLAIVSNAGGPAVLATDALIENGCQLAELGAETLKELSSFLPNGWSRNNPVDILGDATPDRFARASQVVARDPGSDGILVILTPQDMSEPTETAKRLRPLARLKGKPILASWMGGPITRVGEGILNRAGVPTYAHPDTAAKVFADMWRYSRNLDQLYETPEALPRDDGKIDRTAAGTVIADALRDGRTLLDEVESKQLIASYGIPTVPTAAAHSAQEAVEHAEKIGYPVVLKVFSRTITHKTEVNGVQLNIQNADGVRAAFSAIRESIDRLSMDGGFLGVTVQPMVHTDGFELILGSSLDPQLGPVLLVGQGGELVEALKDRALALPPLTAILARRALMNTRIYPALLGVRGRRPVNLQQLDRVIVRFSQLIVEQPRIAECDINPLLVSHDGIVALDARIVLHESSVPASELPRPAIRPYPNQYVERWTLRDGRPVTIRPIRPEDEHAMIRFHEHLSERTVQMRYFQALKYSERVSHQRLIRVCFCDYDRDITLVVELETPAANGEPDIIAVGRITKLPGWTKGEFSLLVSDQVQGQGLGTQLLSKLVEIARDERLTELGADILPQNMFMQRVASKLGFRLEHDFEEQQVTARLKLND